MATTPELPTKRAVEVVTSGSGLEASKKAKLGTGGDYSEFHSFDEFFDRYGDSFQNARHEWRRHLCQLQRECQIREVQLYLRSKGLVEEANEIQALKGDLAYSVLRSYEFSCKGWVLRANPGPYSDYQRLYVADIYDYDEYDELIAEYSHLFCTYASDLAFQKFFKELRPLIAWDLSWSEAHSIGEDVFKKYKDLQPQILGRAIQHARTLNKWEQDGKEMVPLFTKLWQEVVRKERDAMEVLIEIKDNDAASFPFNTSVIKDHLAGKGNFEYFPFIEILENIKRYIDAAYKGEYLDDNDAKELIHKYFQLEGPAVPQPYTYAKYLETKIPVAVKLGLTKS